jgi:hypothetical protein
VYVDRAQGKSAFIVGFGIDIVHSCDWVRTVNRYSVGAWSSFLNRIYASIANFIYARSVKYFR